MKNRKVLSPTVGILRILFEAFNGCFSVGARMTVKGFFWLITFMERRPNRNNQSPNNTKGTTPLSLLDKKRRREEKRLEIIKNKEQC